jgi:uncharacterized protein YndB with AHSA1/START domain
MIDFTIETEIDRPVPEVFAYVTDPALLPSWQANTVSATLEGTPPIRLGSRLREAHSGPGGRVFESLVEVCEYEPDRVFALHVLEGALPVDARITFAPSGAGTVMRFRAHGQPKGLMRLGTPLLARALKRQFAEHCATLKRVLETPPGGPAQRSGA